MKKTMIVLPAFVFILAVAGLSGAVFAADQAQYDNNREAASIEQRIFAKQAELDAVYADPQPDVARAQQLFREIGDLKGQLFAAETGLRSRSGDFGAPLAGRHHRGYRGRRGNGYAGRGGSCHGG
jgi:hypothetical protein